VNNKITFVFGILRSRQKAWLLKHGCKMLQWLARIVRHNVNHFLIISWRPLYQEVN